jgi:hypothetical protein
MPNERIHDDTADEVEGIVDDHLVDEGLVDLDEDRLEADDPVEVGSATTCLTTSLSYSYYYLLTLYTMNKKLVQLAQENDVLSLYEYAIYQQEKLPVIIAESV